MFAQLTPFLPLSGACVPRFVCENEKCSFYLFLLLNTHTLSLSFSLTPSPSLSLTRTHLLKQNWLVQGAAKTWEKVVRKTLPLMNRVLTSFKMIKSFLYLLNASFLLFTTKIVFVWHLPCLLVFYVPTLLVCEYLLRQIWRSAYVTIAIGR